MSIYRDRLPEVEMLGKGLYTSLVLLDNAKLSYYNVAPPTRKQYRINHF